MPIETYLPSPTSYDQLQVGERCRFTFYERGATITCSAVLIRIEGYSLGLGTAFGAALCLPEPGPPRTVMTFDNGIVITIPGERRSPQPKE